MTVRHVINVLRTIVWLCTAVPLTILGGTMFVCSSIIEHVIRWGDKTWHPLHPIHSADRQASPDDVQPPIRVDE